MCICLFNTLYTEGNLTADLRIPFSSFIPPLSPSSLSPSLSPSLPQALAGDLSEANRQACAETTKPLVEAVEALTTFASSPQFASTPAKISAQARKAQEPIIQAGKNVNSSSNSLLTSAKNLVINPNDPPMWQLLASHTKAVTDAIKSLILAIRDKCPGQKECDNAIDCLNENIKDLDQAILSAMSQQLQPHASSTLQVGVA